MKKCISCGEKIHPKRLEILPNATRCVSCSTTDRKAGITVTKGEGDHTYTETIIMERDEFIKYHEAELKARGQKLDDIAPIEDDFVEDGEVVSKSDEDEDDKLDDWDNTLLDGLEDEEDFIDEDEDY